MPSVKINGKLRPILETKRPIVVVYGGRGSGKSLGIGDIMTIKMRSEGADIYCLREYQDSIVDSVHRVMCDSINNRLKLDNFTITDNKITDNLTGAMTTYRGAARNPDSIQSAQGYKYSWFEEAHRASQTSLDKLIPTILRNPGAQCVFTANPQSANDAFSERFINPYKHELDKTGFYQDDIHQIIKVNWRDNPWWNAEQEQIRKWDYDHRSRAKYEWIWEGEFNDEVENSIIKIEWFDAAIDAHKHERLSNAFKPHGIVVAAHDPSDTGNDAKGYALRHGSIIKRVLCKDSGEVDEGCDWALGHAIRDSADWFVWDGDGMGTGLKRQVAESLNGKKMQFHMFKGSLSGSGQDNAKKRYQPIDNEREAQTYDEVFRNNRAQYYILLADRFYNTYRAIVKGEYVDPADMISLDSEGITEMARLRSELCKIPKKENNSGLYQIMSKLEMKSEGIESPNMADSIMMTLWGPSVVEWENIEFPRAMII
jgi:phage terminase large subunit